MGKGMTVLRSPQRKLVPDTKGWIMQANLTEGNSKESVVSCTKRAILRSLVREYRTQGSVRGLSGNRQSYLDADNNINLDKMLTKVYIWMYIK